MILHTIPVGAINTNCYIFGCDTTKEVAIIDPGAEAKKILGLVNDNGYTVKYILLTHGHFDHIMAVAEIKRETDACVGISEADEDCLWDNAKNLFNKRGTSIEVAAADILLKQGDTLQLGELVLEVIATPGHTVGGICIYSTGVLFAGDTLFFEEVGRCDLPGGNFDEIKKSIKNKLFKLPGDTVVYSGHGESTTIAHEIKKNPYVGTIVE